MSEPIRHYFRALEPIHIGAGGYRLGRVDKTIFREAGTNLPKIPGTSLSGAARAYAAMSINKLRAAGGKADFQDKEDKDCPVFYTFGHANDSNAGGYAGVANFGDASLLFFPIHSATGRVWITSPQLLERGGILWEMPDQGAAAAYHKKRFASPGFNLGWAWFSIAAAPGEGAETAQERNHLWARECDMSDVLSIIPEYARPPLADIVVVGDRLIAALVNSNLEVRTSVAIDPESGTAVPKKLFSYEAIPRDSYLTNEIIIDEYRRSKEYFSEESKRVHKHEWNGPMEVVETGLRRMKVLGVGGMGTRGFGRLALLEKPKTKDQDNA